MLARYLNPRWSITGDSVAASDGANGLRRQPRRSLRAPSAHAFSAAAAWALLSVWLFARWNAGAGDCRPFTPARRRGGVPRPAGYLAAGDAKLGGERGERSGSRSAGGNRPRARSVSRRSAGAGFRRAVQRDRR
ncbi:hypothetical protein UA44_22975 [Klebsiella aerogenes]|nr:hypothetical protein UA44_22975 [Klebsiella aerogenes]